MASTVRARAAMATALLDAETAATGGEGCDGAGGSGSDRGGDLRTRETTHRSSGGHRVGQHGARKSRAVRCDARHVFEASMRTVKAWRSGRRRSTQRGVEPRPVRYDRTRDTDPGPRMCAGLGCRAQPAKQLPMKLARPAQLRMRPTTTRSRQQTQQKAVPPRARGVPLDAQVPQLPLAC